MFRIDPPYYLTKDCYSINYPDMRFHEELAELLHNIKGKFILCLRINASRSNNSQNNKFIDRTLYEFYNNSYGNGNFYMYCDDFDNDKLMINFKNVGTLEAVISNYKFDGCESIATVLSKYEKMWLSQRIQQVRVGSIMNNDNGTITVSGNSADFTQVYGIIGD